MNKGGGNMFAGRFLLILMVLSLVVVLVSACGGDDNDSDASFTTSQTTTAMSTPLATTTTGGEPVKIGVLTAWSGPAAMAGPFFADTSIKTVEKQVEDMWGILGGRPVEFIRGDTGGQVAGAVSAAIKLITNDNVSALAVGGASPAEMTAISELAEEERVFFSCANSIVGIEDLEYTVEANMSSQASANELTDFLLELATPRPDTVGFLNWNDPDQRALVDHVKQNLEDADAGIETVYDEYLDPSIMDLSPYLTQIKHADPDYIFVSIDTSQFMAMAKQIMELGGWGDIKVITVGTASSSIGMPGAEGWFVITSWHPAKDDPASVKFRENFETVNGRTPTDMHVYFYNAIWTAVQAIEQAGTDDPVDVARFARSGNLEFDSPMGRAHFDTDGHSGLGNMVLQIQDGTMVPFSP